MNKTKNIIVFVEQAPAQAVETARANFPGCEILLLRDSKHRAERVRESHRALNGKLCRWDDDTVYSEDGGKTWKSRAAIGGYIGHPGADYQCRCISSPDLSGLLAEIGVDTEGFSLK